MDTYINGSIGMVGAATTWKFDFLLDKDSRHIGLPQSDIDELGLKPSLFATPKELGGHARTLEDRAYEAGTHFDRCYMNWTCDQSQCPKLALQRCASWGSRLTWSKDALSNRLNR